MTATVVPVSATAVPMQATAVPMAQAQAMPMQGQVAVPVAQPMESGSQPGPMYRQTTFSVKAMARQRRTGYIVGAVFFIIFIGMMIRIYGMGCGCPPGWTDNQEENSNTCKDANGNECSGDPFSCRYECDDGYNRYCWENAEEVSCDGSAPLDPYSYNR